MADGSARAETKATGGSPFFGISGRYVVAEGADPIDLLNDLSCLAECAEGALQAIVDGMGDEDSAMRVNPRDAVKLAFSAMYNVQMMANLANAAIRLQPSRKPKQEGASNG